MKEQEIPQAVRYQSRRFIPIPLKDATLDWQIVKGSPLKKERLEILVVAVPNEIMSKYKSIANLANLDLVAIEPEAFSTYTTGTQTIKRAID